MKRSQRPTFRDDDTYDAGVLTSTQRSLFLLQVISVIYKATDLPFSKPPEPVKDPWDIPLPPPARGIWEQTWPLFWPFCVTTEEAGGKLSRASDHLPFKPVHSPRAQGALECLASGSAVKCVIVRLSPAHVFPRRTFKMFSSLENVLKKFHCIRLCLLIFHKAVSSLWRTGFPFLRHFCWHRAT